MYFEAATDGREHGQCKLTAQVLAKFLQAAKDRAPMAGIPEVLRKLGHVQGKAASQQQFNDAPPLVLREVAGKMRVGAVQGHPDGDSFAMPQAVAGELLKAMRRPMSEIQGPRRAHLEWIAVMGDMLHVKPGAAVNQRLHRRHAARGQCGSTLLEPGEEAGVFQQRNLYCLGYPTAPVAVRERGEELGIVNDRG